MIFFSSHSVILEKNREKNQSESSSSSSRCDREIVLDDLIFDFSEVLSDNLTTDLDLAFWPTTHSGKILL